MAEQQQQPQEQYTQEQAPQEQQYYPAFQTADGYSVPGGLFHPPTAQMQLGAGLTMPGQSFVGPPLLDGQPAFQLGGAPGFSSAPLQIGIPGGFHFAPEYSDPPESALSAPSPFTVVTRGADVLAPRTGKKAGFKCPWCTN